MSRTILMFTSVCVFAFATCPSPCAAEDDSNAVMEVTKSYEEQLGVLIIEQLETAIAAREGYVEALEQVRQQVVQDGEVEQALRITRLVKRVQGQIADERAQLSLLLPRAAVEVQGDGFVLKTLRRGATAYSNRDHVWRRVPAELDGWQFTQIAGGDTPSIRLQVKSAGVVFAATASSKDLEKRGWRRIQTVLLRYSEPGSPDMVVFTKQAAAGDELEIPHQGWTGTIVLVPKAGPPRLEALHHWSPMQQATALTSNSLDAILPTIEGTWIFHYSNNTQNTRIIKADRTVNNNGRIMLRDSHLLIVLPNVIERLTLDDDKILMEHFNPKSTYPNGHPVATAVGTRVQQRVNLSER